MSASFDEEVVAAFNVLGYQATFAAVAERLAGTTSAAELYDLYPSRDALAQAWLTGEIPDPGGQTGVRSMFAGFMHNVVGALGGQRDFARAWLAAAPANGVPNLKQWQQLHDAAHEYFRTCLVSLGNVIALPPPLVMADVADDLAEALCGAAAMLVAAWQADRSEAYGRTAAAIDSSACLVDALLVRREHYLDNSLLVHLHRLAGLPHEQFVKPLVDLLLPGASVQRLGSAPALVDLLRDLLPPHTPSAP